MKDELGKKIMTKFVKLRAKTYSYMVTLQITVLKIKMPKAQKMCNKKKT